MNPYTGELTQLSNEQKEMTPLEVLKRDGVIPVSDNVADLLRAGMRARNRSERRLAKRIGG